jgi:hypothetical protein
MMLMTVLGGKGTVSGPIVGAFVFVAINEFLAAQLGSTELNIVAVGVLLVLLFLSKGIVGRLKESNRLPAILDRGLGDTGRFAWMCAEPSAASPPTAPTVRTGSRAGLHTFHVEALVMSRGQDR